MYVPNESAALSVRQLFSTGPYDRLCRLASLLPASGVMLEFSNINKLVLQYNTNFLSKDGEQENNFSAQTFKISLLLLKINRFYHYATS